MVTVVLRGAAARVVVEQLQDEALLGESRRLRGRPDRPPKLASRKVAPNDVVEIASDGVLFIDKERLLRLEVAGLKLKREVRGGRDGGHGTDRFALALSLDMPVLVHILSMYIFSRLE